MYAVKAIYDGINFKPIQPIHIREQYEVVITFIEPLNKNDKKLLYMLREPDLTKEPTIGECDGMFVISDDFNDSLEEMMEYKWK